MAFWHNTRYEEVEKSSQGDPMRGLPKHEFPWLLGYSTFPDNMNDIWHYEFSCLGITPEKNKDKVKAVLFMIAESQVSKMNLKQMDISSDRLDSMNVISWNHLEEKYSCDLICELDKIDSKAKIIVEKWISSIKKKYTIELKSKILLTKIRASKISRFSEGL